MKGVDFEARQQAIDPNISVYVSANAGSGKTTVLSNRVIRLLLSGVDPARILCLTYTKAAAAEMQDRIFKELGRWVLLDAQELAQVLQRLHNSGAHPSQKEIEKARQLFARAVETPGGLKVQTIHAFCEKLLQRFPFEADVAPRFSILEDASAKELRKHALQDVIDAALKAPETSTGMALQTIMQEVAEEQFHELIKSALEMVNRDAVHLKALTSDDQIMRQFFSIAPNETIATIEYEMLFLGIGRNGWQGIAAQLLGRKKRTDTDCNAAESIMALARKYTHQIAASKEMEEQAAKLVDQEDLQNYLQIFFTNKLQPRSWPTAVLRREDPALCALVDAEKARLAQLLLKRNAYEVAQRSQALHILTAAMQIRYQYLKERRAALDFNDLIEKTQNLLKEPAASWIRYRLDESIDHVLVDEAQDNSPQMWEIVKALTAEFFSGEGANRNTRSFFAVGDEKQSIFSFQGAQPEAFRQTMETLRRKARDADMAFNKSELRLSFRSTDEILTLVDKVFEDQDQLKGLVEDGVPPTHTGVRKLKAQAAGNDEAQKAAPGLVELWQEEQKTKQEDISPWETSEEKEQIAPSTRLARRIAKTIKHWLHTQKRYADDGKIIRAGDIIILVRRRKQFFQAMLKALREEEIPVAGADRLQVNQHIAVLDLLAAARFALRPVDDYSLACLLKSPLFGLSDEDLLTLTEHQELALWDNLCQAPAYQYIKQRLAQWIVRARTHTPYHFFAQILILENGLAAYHGALGRDACEAIEAFLDQILALEGSVAASLFKFTELLAQGEEELKRQLGSDMNEVRIMTVHNAKGLESRIVFLADTISAPYTPTQRLYSVAAPDSEGESLLLWAAAKNKDSPQTAELSELEKQKQRDEYRRLLYVAMTRARDRLYICGYNDAPAKEKKNVITKPDKRNWHEMITHGLEALSLQMPEYFVSVTDDIGKHDVLRYKRSGDESKDALEEGRDGGAVIAIPEWLFTKPRTIPNVAPADQMLTPSKDKIYSDQSREDRDNYREKARLRGLLVHQILETLSFDQEVNETHLTNLYKKALVKIPEAKNFINKGEIIPSLQKLLSNANMKSLFAKAGLAEIALEGDVILTNGEKASVSGRIDRLLIEENELIFCDFKTGKPAKHSGEISAQIMRQMALYSMLLKKIYPKHQQRAYIIWVEAAEISILSERDLRIAYKNIGNERS